MPLAGVSLPIKNKSICRFLLPPEMMVLFKPQIDFITEHAIDPDKRRYAVPMKAPVIILTLIIMVFILTIHYPENGMMRLQNIRKTV